VRSISYAESGLDSAKKSIRYTPVLNLQSAPLSATKYITIIDNTQNNIPELEPFFALLIAGIVATVLFLQKNRA
jgi:hypothetical protein